MTRFLYDTAVFVYALGAEHRYAEPCREIVRRAGDRAAKGEASVDLLQELLHHRLRRTRDRTRAVADTRAAAALCRLHPVEPSDLARALVLFEGAERLGARDAVFAAVALNRGVDAILSPDRAFDEVPGLTRVDPADRSGVEALLS